MEQKKIAIIGLGLIGGSLALQLRDKRMASLLIGVDNSKQHGEAALQLGLVDRLMPLDAAIANADVIVLATPVDVMLSLLPYILDRVSDQIVLDMGSVKACLTDCVNDHPKRGRYVATHPMWGTEHSGPGAAVRNAFWGKAAVICNAAQSDDVALLWAIRLYNSIGMHLLYMDAHDHDMHAAYVSHISHITSFALANTVLEKEREEQTIFNLASAGFEGTVRLAKSNAAMWVPILQQNRENILDVLDEHIAQLQKFRTSLSNGNGYALNKLIGNANRISHVLNKTTQHNINKPLIKSL